MTYIRVIKNMYDRAKTQARTLGGDSKLFLFKMGLHQKSTLKPVLFVLMMNVLTQYS